MPLYEYQCQQCSRRVEKIQKFSDAPLTTCPHCGGALERTLTAPAIQFKGSGWYKDLYSSPGPAGTEKSGETAAPAAGGGGDGAPASADGKTAATPAASPAPSPAPSTPASAGAGGTTGSGA